MSEKKERLPLEVYLAINRGFCPSCTVPVKICKSDEGEYSYECQCYECAEFGNKVKPMIEERAWKAIAPELRFGREAHQIPGEHWLETPNDYRLIQVLKDENIVLRYRDASEKIYRMSVPLNTIKVWSANKLKWDRRMVIDRTDQATDETYYDDETREKNRSAFSDWWMSAQFDHEELEEFIFDHLNDKIIVIK